LFLGAKETNRVCILQQKQQKQQAALLLISPEIIIVVAFYSVGLFVHVRASIVQKAISRALRHNTTEENNKTPVHKYRRVSARALARSVLKL
jgi:hypothetical protein